MGCGCTYGSGHGPVCEARQRHDHEILVFVRGANSPPIRRRQISQSFPFPPVWCAQLRPLPISCMFNCTEAATSLRALHAFMLFPRCSSEAPRVLLNLHENRGLGDELTLKWRRPLWETLADGGVKPGVVQQQLCKSLLQDPHTIAEVLKGGHHRLVNAIRLLPPITRKGAHHLLHLCNVNFGRYSLLMPLGSSACFVNFCYQRLGHLHERHQVWETPHQLAFNKILYLIT